MSVSTDGILFFGFTFHEEDSYDKEPPPWMEDTGGWEDFYVAKKGLIKPVGNDYEDPVFKKAREDYWAAKREMLKNEPCEIGYHGGEGCMSYFVTIKESHKSASRGYPEKLKSTFGDIESDWFHKIATFCQLMEIDYQEPAWYLASYWG
jgi:hypothetical protein